MTGVSPERRRSQQGMTLVELIVAFTILALLTYLIGVDQGYLKPLPLQFPRPRRSYPTCTASRPASKAS